MNEFTLGMAMFLGLMSQTAERPPTYEMNHFYYHDRTNAIKSLPLQNKLWLPPNDKSKEIINKYQLANEKLEDPHRKGYVLTGFSRAETLKWMKRLGDKKVAFQPVVQWEDMECVPTNRIVVQVRPFVTEAILAKRLVDMRAFKIKNLSKVDGFIYLIEVEEPILPPNILATANMLSEDSAWFAWARCVFEPLRMPISGAMTITQGQTDLGFKRSLEVTISVYKPSIKVRKDLLPKLGQNRFLPAPQKDESWYDFDPPTITEEVTPERTIIKLVFPFRYLNHGTLHIQPFQVAYEDGKKKGEIWVSGIQYKNTSIIEGTEIEDIQPIDWNYQVAKVPDVEAPPKQLVPLTRIGFITLGSGLSLFALTLLIGLIRLQATAMKNWMVYDSKRKLWNSLHAIAKKIGKGDVTKWREQYLEAERRLMAVMAEFFGINHPVASDDPALKSRSVKLALAELEKLYKPNGKPDMRALSGHLLRVYTEGTDV